jgi:hypothetical protein
MSRARRRLIFLFTLVLFGGWVGWIAYLALTTRRPIVLSRPQLLASKIDVVGQVKAVEGRPDPEVTVEQVVWAADGQPRLERQTKIRVVNLPGLTPQDGWDGPGAYLLPLVKQGAAFEVAKIPLSPGIETTRPRIYPATPEALEQLHELRQPAP